MANPNLDTAAGQPATVTTKAGTVSQFPIDAQIAYDRYAAQKAARGKKYGGIIFSKILPSGPCPDQQGTQTGGGSFDSLGGV